MTTSSLMGFNELVAREPDLKRLRDAYNLLSTNRTQAIDELEELANTGSVLSMEYLAHAYQSAPNIDPVKTEKWYKSAYERGSAKALINLAIHYHLCGNYVDAENIYKDGVSKNDCASMYWLANFYVERKRYDVKSAEIRTLLERSAALGQVRAMQQLSLLYIQRMLGDKKCSARYFSVLFCARGGL